MYLLTRQSFHQGDPYIDGLDVLGLFSTTEKAVDAKMYYEQHDGTEDIPTISYNITYMDYDLRVENEQMEDYPSAWYAE